VRMQQGTVNLLADMGVQPGTLQSGLVAASASTDASAPSSTITSPAAGATLAAATAVTISGTAIDTGGGVVGGVEVSVDGGLTWHPASGRASWSYSWTTPATGSSVTIKSRAVDDSGNLESPTSGITVTVGSGSQTCPCSIWSNAATPAIVADPDTSAVELGVKFRANSAGSITAIRFYKASTNTGPFVVNLWSRTGTRLSTAQVTSTTSSGWQQVALPAPVPIDANTTYVASYHTASGHYSANNSYFGSSVTAGPLTALANGLDGGNGVYAYGAGGFPTQTYNASNYWVDVVFTTTVAADTTPPVVTTASPASDATQVDPRTSVSIGFSEAMDANTITSNTIVLLDAASNLVPSSVTYSSSSLTATLTPNAALDTTSAYTTLVKGGSTDPRVKDKAGNPMSGDVSWSFATAGLLPTQGPGGPILVVTSAFNPFSSYYAEILRTEGLNLFQVADIANLSAALLAQYDVVILGQTALTSAQVATLSDWTNAGGNLIAMRPDKQLAGLLGLTDSGTTLSKGYLLVDTSRPPGAGLVAQTIQYQGTADRYTLNGATSVATLYSNASTVTTSPAVTLRSVGTNGGEAAAFTYDLARSVVSMRQGNAAWSGQERDGVSPIRSDDLFFGASAQDPQPDWVDLNKVAIPQADEQQRLLANLIVSMNQGRRPLPRFWYFPRGLTAAVIMTGDDHGNGGTAGRFDSFKASSPSGCVVDDWECIRGTSYVYPGTPISDAQAAAYNQQGFEIALHLNTSCANYTQASLDDAWVNQLAQWKQQFPSLPSPATNRTHCITWSDYSTQPQVELTHGIRLDTNYYYWPPVWVNDRPGFFTGSGMPMRVTTPAGAMIDVYHAVSQMTDESAQSYPFTIDALLDKATGPEAYYGAFTINAHTDQVSSVEASAVVSSAKARGVPIVSARQMLRWLDGRNNSSFSGVSWNGNTLTFAIKVAPGTRGLQAMVPVPAGMQVSSVTANGSAVGHGTASIKGVTYVFVMASTAAYQVVFAPGVAASSPSPRADIPLPVARRAPNQNADVAATPARRRDDAALD
jgi:large repetitive protein